MRRKRLKVPRPPAEFELLHLYKGKVQMKYFPNSHTYKVYDLENDRDWEVSPSATGLTDKMEKGAGLMMYSMSEAMKYMDQVFQNKPLRVMVDDEKFTFKKLFQDARQAHKTKSDLGKRVGNATHDYVERLLKNFKTAQDSGTQFKVPAIPRAMDLASDLQESWMNIVNVYDFKTPAIVDKYREVVNRDITMRKDIWSEALMVQRACEAAKDFFVAAAKAGAIRVWAVEQMVHSREYFYSGRFDAILEFVEEFVWREYPIHAGVYIADLKTSNPGVDFPMGLFPNHLAQTGLYDVAYCEEYPEVAKRIKGHLLLGSSKHGDGFHPYVSLKRGRNRKWAKSLVPVMEYMHQAEKELKGLQLYGGSK